LISFHRNSDYFVLLGPIHLNFIRQAILGFLIFVRLTVLLLQV
jgi:hypothetical protein